MTKYTKHYSTRSTSQSRPIPGTSQMPNSAGGYSWPVDDWMRLDRFLILGTDGGTYYISERDLTIDSAEAVRRCIDADGPRVVARTVEISDAGRAPKNDPAIFVLAMCAKLGDDMTRKLARAALPKVCRIGTHLMHFAGYLEAFGGWGRGTRNAVARWFTGKPADRLAYQVVKYQRRDGWSTRDLLRLSHPRAASPAHGQIFQWVTTGELAADADDALRLIDAFERAKSATSADEIVMLVAEYGLPREGIPTEWLKSPRVWEALLARMPMTAMIRNLGNMTRVGLAAPMSAATRLICQRLADGERLRKARVHPIAVLAALMTYKAGRGVRGKLTWSPVGSIVDALDAAFYAAFGNARPSGARTLLALDVSSSMTWGEVARTPGLTPRVASAAMALITAATEPAYSVVAFTSGTGGMKQLSISPRQRLDDVVKTISDLPFGGTDCALPMKWAEESKTDVDLFCVYTDSETWAGKPHPAQALTRYRARRDIAAKLVVIGMVSNGFSIADPNDAGMLDVVGFDTATPKVISDFARA